jgi:sugar porter (SP) family MFS transporter
MKMHETKRLIEFKENKMDIKNSSCYASQDRFSERDNNRINIGYVIKVSLFSAIAGLLFGFDTGIISGALQFVIKTFNIPSDAYLVQEMIVSSVPVGALVGAIFSKSSSEKMGRKKSIILTSILFIIGTFVASLAENTHGVILGRLILGFAVGLSAMIVPMYLSEVSPPSIRGGVVFCFQLAITIGLFVAFLINYIFAGSGNWRAMFLIGLIPAAILGIGMFFLPYSPRWLMMKNREEQARSVLSKLRKSDNVEQELEEIKESLRYKQKNFRSLFMKPLRSVTMICFFLFAFQQLSGVNTIMYYAPVIYKNAGFKYANGQILASLADGIAFVLATVVAVWLVDKIGRRPLFFIGFTGMIFCLVLLGTVYQNIFSLELNKTLSLIAVIGHIIFFGISLGPLCYLMMSELFPLNTRSIGMAIASCGNWGFNVIVSSTFLTLIDLITISYTFYFYAFCTFIGLLMCYFLIPETKGVSLEHIEDNLYNNKGTRYIGSLQETKR